MRRKLALSFITTLLSCFHDVRTFFPSSKSHLDYVNHGIIAALVFRQLFFAVMRCLLIFCAVLRYSDSPNVLLIVGTEYQDGVREGRRGTGKRERAAKGDGKGKTSDCLTTKRRITH